MSDEKYKGYYRVTEILSPYSGLSNIDPTVLKKAADRGSRVHDFCELYANKMLFTKIDEDCEPYVTSFVQWFESYVDDVIFTEKRLFCDELNITGQIDLLVKIRGEKVPSLVDIKTPQMLSKTWGLQLAAYTHLMDANSIPYGNKFVLQLNKDGFDAVIHDFSSQHTKNLSVFKKMVDVHKFFNPIS